MTVRLDRDMRVRLDRLARATVRTRAFLAQQAIRSYLGQNEWQIAAIEEGLRSADAGQLLEQGPVEAWLKSWGTRKERRRPRPRSGSR